MRDGKPCGLRLSSRRRGGSRYAAFIKRQKRRLERHRAKADPECVRGYGRYNGFD